MNLASKIRNGVLTMIINLKQQVRDLKDDRSGYETSTSTSSIYSASDASESNMSIDEEELSGQGPVKQVTQPSPKTRDNVTACQEEEFQQETSQNSRKSPKPITSPTATINRYSPLANATTDNTNDPEPPEKRTPPPIFIKSTQ